jgi:hypothetical protein
MVDIETACCVLWLMGWLVCVVQIRVGSGMLCVCVPAMATVSVIMTQ